MHLEYFGHLVGHNGKIISSVLLPAAFAAIGTTRLFLSVADKQNTLSGNAHIGKIFFRACRTTLAEDLVILNSPSFIAITLDPDLYLRVSLEPFHIRLHDLAGFGLDQSLIKIEIHRLKAGGGGGCPLPGFLRLRCFRLLLGLSRRCCSRRLFLLCLRYSRNLGLFWTPPESQHPDT